MAKFRAVRSQALNRSHRVPERFRYGKAKHCYWCGCTLNYGLRFLNQPQQATRDHLMPRSKGGFGGDWNIVAACRSCNSRRGSSLSWTPFHERPRARVDPNSPH